MHCKFNSIPASSAKKCILRDCVVKCKSAKQVKESQLSCSHLARRHVFVPDRQFQMGVLSSLLLSRHPILCANVHATYNQEFHGLRDTT